VTREGAFSAGQVQFRLELRAATAALDFQIIHANAKCGGFWRESSWMSLRGRRDDRAFRGASVLDLPLMARDFFPVYV